VKVRWRDVVRSAHETGASRPRVRSPRPWSRRLTCPLVPASSSAFPSLAHLTASARFRARAHGPVSGRLCGTAAWRGRPSRPGFPLRFRCRHSLLGHPMPAGGLGLPHGRLTGHARGRARTSTGLPRSARTSCDRGGCPLYPGDGGAHPGRGTCSAGAHRSAAASPLSLLLHPTRRGLLHEASTRVHAIHPSGLPWPVAARVERAALGLLPGLRTPPSPATHAEDGTGRRARTWNYTLTSA